GCETEVVVPAGFDPNPTKTDIEGDPNATPPVPPSASALVMRGGIGLRYYQVVDRKSGVPIIGAGVVVTVARPSGTTTSTMTTDGEGRIASAGEKGLAV